MVTCLAQPGRRRGGSGPADVARLLLLVVELAARGLDARADKRPGAHVLRLLLHPAHLEHIPGTLYVPAW